VHSQLAASLEAEKEKVKEATGTINTLSASRDNSKKEHEARIADLSQKLQELEEESRTLKNQLSDADTLFVTSNEKHKSALEDVAKLRDKLKNVVPQAVYDQLKQEMVDRTEYDRVCQELAELRLQRSAPWPPREPLSRASSMSSTVGASFTSYASPYAQQHSPSPTSIV
jgi:chromosome segregation ATPase